MLKVAILCKTLLKGGAEKQALLLAKFLPLKNIKIFLINWNGKKIDPENYMFILNNSIQYYPLKGSIWIKFLEFNKILKNAKVNFLVSYLTYANIVACFGKVVNRKIKIVGGIRNEKLPLIKFIFEKIIHNKVNDATIFNNYSGKEKFIARGFKAEKIVVIQNAIESSSLLKEPAVKDNQILRIITIGRFVKQKDYETALYTFKLLCESVTNKALRYTIIGYGPLENGIRALAETLNISDRIELLINPPNIGKILEISDIFLSTSLFEGVSNSIMEAMANGLPIVATKVGDNSYLVKDGFNGYLVPCKNVEATMKMLKLLCESDELRKALGKNSLQLLEKEFSEGRFIDNYTNLFSKLKDK